MKKLLLLVYLLSCDVAASTSREDLAELGEAVVQMKRQADEARSLSYDETLVEKIWLSAVEARNRFKVFYTAAEEVRRRAYNHKEFEGQMTRKEGTLYGLSVLAEGKYRGLKSTVNAGLRLATTDADKVTNLAGELERAKYTEHWAIKVLSAADFIRARIYEKNAVYGLSFYKEDVDKTLDDARILRRWGMQELARISSRVEYLSSENIEKRHRLAYKAANDYLVLQSEVIVEIYKEIDRQYKILEKKTFSEVKFQMRQARGLQLNIDMMARF
jgi:hypothetical protein